MWLLWFNVVWLVVTDSSGEMDASSCVSRFSQIKVGKVQYVLSKVVTANLENEVFQRALHNTIQQCRRPTVDTARCMQPQLYDICYPRHINFAH
jgi:hypothetical protein